MQDLLLYPPHLTACQKQISSALEIQDEPLAHAIGLPAWVINRLKSRQWRDDSRLQEQSVQALSSRDVIPGKERI